MKKIFSVAVSFSLLLGSATAFADDESSASSDSSSSSSSSVSSVSSSSSSFSPTYNTQPCMKKVGTERTECFRERAKAKNNPERVRMNTLVHERNAACRNETGLAKVDCLQQRMPKKEEKVKKPATSALQWKIIRRALRDQRNKHSRGASSSSSSVSSEE